MTDLFFPDRPPCDLIAHANVPLCTTCGSDDFLFPDHDYVGSVVCACGTIQPLVFVDKRPKFKGHAKDEDMVKDECVDMFIDPHMPKSSMSIVMSQGGSNTFQHLRRIQNGYLPSDERATLQIMDNIRAHTDTRRFPTSVVQDAAILFRKLQNNSKVQGDCTRGDIRRALIASCVLYTCRTLRVVKTPEEVARAFDLTSEQFTKGWSRFSDICAHRGFADMSLDPLQARDYLYRCSKRLHLCWPTTDLALRVSDHVRAQQWCNNNTPASVAGAILIMLRMAMTDGPVPTDLMVELASLTPQQVATFVDRVSMATVSALCDMSATTLLKIVKLLQGHWSNSPEPTRTTTHRRSKKRLLDGVVSLES